MGSWRRTGFYDSVTAIPNGGGDHSLMAADTDGDLGQELITGAYTISSKGAFQCTSAMGHGDAMDIGELVPGKGITVFSIHEGLGGMDAHNGATCAFYFKTTEQGTDSNRGRADYIGPGDEKTAQRATADRVTCIWPLVPPATPHCHHNLAREQLCHLLGRG